MKTVTAYITEDGTLHRTEEAAQKHAMALSRHDEIDAFLASEYNPYTSTAQRGIVRQSIINWEIWKAHE